jgi:hypothetical protein
MAGFFKSLVSRVAGNAAWELIKWGYLQAIGPTALSFVVTVIIGWLRGLSLTHLVGLAVIVVGIAYLLISLIVGYFRLRSEKSATDGRVQPPPRTRASAIRRLGSSADAGLHLLRNFAESSPTRDQVNEWWLRVLETAELPVLENEITTGDIHRLKMSSPGNPEALLSEKSGAWTLNSERISTYDILNVRARRLRELIGKINSG